ncbi:MAG: hypothetical protein ACREA5_01795 [Nitrosotalea sp.]
MTDMTYDSAEEKGKKLTDEEMMKEIGAKHGIVILLDALGMQHMWQTKYPKDILHSWEILITAIKNGFDADCKKYGIELSFQVFSDTVLITATGKIFTLLLEIPPLLRKFILIGMLLGFYFRGCMSRGLFYPSTTETKLIIGPAISEAAQYYEQMDMIGVVINPSLHKLLKEMMADNDVLRKNLGYYYTQYDVPMKYGISKQHWIMKQVPNTDLTKIGYDRMKMGATTYVELIKKKIDQYSSEPKIKKKWENTLAFFEYTQ